MILKQRSNLVSGTSLVELLVVIVVFLIGILAIAQIFPGGLNILSTTRAETMAAGLAHSEMDRLRGFADQLPDQIVPVTYTVNGGNLVETITDINPNNFGPEGSSIQQASGTPSQWGLIATSWDVFNNSTDLGPWQLLSGANNIRHIIGEGKVVPSPSAVGNFYGCLMPLQFAPVLPPPSAGGSPVFVYGNDLQRTEGAPSGSLVDNNGIPTSGTATGYFVLPGYAVPSYQYYWNDSTASAPFLFIPEDPNETNASDNLQPNLTHEYRISFVALINTSGGLVQRSIVIPSQSVPPMPQTSGGAGSAFPIANGLGAYYELAIAPIVPLNGGESLVSIDFESVRVARDYDYVASSGAFDATYNPDGTPHNPYQYMVLNPSLGFLLINPLAYGYVQQTLAGSAIALQARADYDIYDWRILKEDFRMPETAPYQYQLKLSNLKHQNGYEADNTYFQGIPTGGVLQAPASLVVVDQDTGGVLAPNVFSVNYHLGLLSFNPNGTSMSEILPNQATATSVANAFTHDFRVYYEGVGEWATQVTKGAANYLQVSMTPPIPGEFYIAPPASGSTANGSDVISFSNVDLGQTISFDELWYQWKDSQGNLHTSCARGQSAVVKLIGGSPGVAITDIDPLAVSADFSNGYAVRNAKGLSVLVREFWNPNTVNFSASNGANNLTPFNTWETAWRTNTTEGLLEKGTLQ